MVPHAGHGIRVARDFPAAEVLALHGEKERFGVWRREPLFEVFEAFGGVVLFVGDGICGVGKRDGFGIFFVGHLDQVVGPYIGSRHLERCLWIALL